MTSYAEHAKAPQPLMNCIFLDSCTHVIQSRPCQIHPIHQYWRIELIVHNKTKATVYECSHSCLLVVCLDSDSVRLAEKPVAADTSTGISKLTKLNQMNQSNSYIKPDFNARTLLGEERLVLLTKTNFYKKNLLKRPFRIDGAKSCINGDFWVLYVLNVPLFGRFEGNFLTFYC